MMYKNIFPEYNITDDFGYIETLIFNPSLNFNDVKYFLLKANYIHDYIDDDMFKYNTNQDKDLYKYLLIKFLMEYANRIFFIDYSTYEKKYIIRTPMK